MMKKEIELKHKSRRLSIKEGIFATAKTSLGYSYLSPFAIAMKISSPIVALLSSIAGLVPPLSQIWGSKLIEKNSRKKVMSRNVLFETLVWIPFIIIAILYLKNIISSFLPFLFLFVFTLYHIASGLIHPAWFSWVGDLVDEKFRGRWFSKRNSITKLTGVVLGVCSAFLLEYFKRTSNEIIGFIILFSLAFLARLYTVSLIKKQYEPKIKIRKKDEFSFLEFLKKSPKTNFGKMALFRTTLAFATHISSSLFAIYILRELGYSYVIYILITFVPAVFSIFTLKMWGKIGDKYGNYKILLITTLFIPLIPIAIILSTSKIYLILVPSILTAFSWAGFDLAMSNFTYDNVSKNKRAFANSYYNLMVGLGTFLGGIGGALLIKFLKISFVEPIIFIFILGGILRMVAVYFWIPKLKEIRKVKNSKSFKEFVIKQAKPTLIEETHELASIKNYLMEK